jgi:hypothetical protein
MLETVIDKKNKIWHVYADNSVVIEIRTSGILHILFRTFFHFSQSPPLPLSIPSLQKNNFKISPFYLSRFFVFSLIRV